MQKLLNWLNQLFSNTSTNGSDEPTEKLLSVMDSLVQKLESGKIDDSKAQTIAKNLVILETVCDSLKSIQSGPALQNVQAELEMSRKRIGSALSKVDKNQLKKSLEETGRNLPLFFTEL